MTRVPTTRLSPAASATSTDTGDDWRHRAACKDADAELFFAADEERVNGRKPRVAAAKAICGTCSVWTACRRWALENRIPEGVWGGLDEAERRDILNPTDDTCGTGAGRSRHRRAGTPVCDICLAYENRLRAANNLRNWQKLAPYLDRGHSLEQAAAAIGLGLDAARKARNAVQRQQQQTAA